MGFSFLQFCAAAGAVSLLIFVLYLIFGIFSRKSRHFMKAGIAMLISIAFNAYVGFTSATMEQETSQQLASLRTGADLYGFLYNEPPATCMEMLEGSTYRIPFIERCIWLQFTTCPEALEAFLAQYPYSMKIRKKNDLMFEVSGIEQLPEWWNPQSLGDSVRMYTYTEKDPSTVRKVFVSMDSSRVYYYDLVY
jgi:hypothetical protein